MHGRPLDGKLVITLSPPSYNLRGAPKLKVKSLKKILALRAIIQCPFFSPKFWVCNLPTLQPKGLNVLANRVHAVKQNRHIVKLKNY